MDLENISEIDDNTLSVSLSDGRKVEIEVVDIIESSEFNKDFILYTIGDNKDDIYASILDEQEESYSLNTITDEKEIEFVNKLISEVAEETK